MANRLTKGKSLAIKELHVAGCSERLLSDGILASTDKETTVAAKMTS